MPRMAKVTSELLSFNIAQVCSKMDTYDIKEDKRRLWIWTMTKQPFLHEEWETWCFGFKI